MEIWSEGKVTYTEADSVSERLPKDIRKGDKKSLEILKDVADEENPEYPESKARAIYELGEVYMAGLCEVERSREKALELFNKAAELGDALALIKLGEYYRDGKQGFKQDGQRALKYFTAAGERGNQKGYELAAEMFRDGKGGFNPSGQRAIEFYELINEHDDTRILLEIAKIYTTGRGDLKPNRQAALEIYKEIIRHGEFWAEVYDNFGIESPRLEGYKEALENAAKHRTGTKLLNIFKRNWIQGTATGLKI